MLHIDVWGLFRGLYEKRATALRPSLNFRLTHPRGAGFCVTGSDREGCGVTWCDATMDYKLQTAM